MTTSRIYADTVEVRDRQAAEVLGALLPGWLALADVPREVGGTNAWQLTRMSRATRNKPAIS